MYWYTHCIHDHSHTYKQRSEVSGRKGRPGSNLQIHGQLHGWTRDI